MVRHTLCVKELKSKFAGNSNETLNCNGYK